MDDRRFDLVVRSLARHRSRRALVRGLLAGGVALLASCLRLPSTAARQGYSAQGEPCFDDDQCLAADTPLVCAWNGYGSAGAACCAAVGGRCGDDSGCCGPNTCYLGTCANLSFPGPGEACWQLPVDPDPCAYGGAVCIHDWQSGDVWGTCQPLSTGAACTWQGCDCFQGAGDADPCDRGLVCCHYSDNQGTCAPLYTCTGYGAPGDACPQYCLPGPTECPGCVSGYCTPAGYCG
jgi:hypothetical protein